MKVIPMPQKSKQKAIRNWFAVVDTKAKAQNDPAGNASQGLWN